MLDSSTLGGCIVSILLYLLLFIYAMLQWNDIKSNKVPMWIHIIILLFCIFAFWDTDYYHYKEALNDLNINYGIKDQWTHLETIYVWLYDFCGRSYFWFRLLVWGIAYLFFVVMATKLKIYNNLTFALFIILFLLTFSYARVSLGMTSLFLAGVLCFSDKHRLLNIILGLLCLVLCYFSHRSMLPVLCLLPLCLLKYNRYLWAMVATMVFTFVFYNSDWIIMALNTSVDMAEADDVSYETLLSAGGYVDRVSEISAGISMKLYRLIQYISILLPIFIIVRKNVYKYCCSKMQCRVLCNSAILIAISALAMGLLASFYSAMCYRYLYMAYVPIVLLVSKLYNAQVVTKKQVQIIIFLGGIVSLYRLAYVIYTL